MKKFFLIILLPITVWGSAFPIKNLNKSDTSRYMLAIDDPTNSEIKLTEFNQAITEIYSLYVLEGVKQSRHLNLFMEWETPYFSAWAVHLKEDQYQINFWGGFARIPGMLKETFEFVVCHELGHILGGEPRHTNKNSPWASAEGQSDHFAVTKCLPKYYKQFNKTDFDSTTSMPYELDQCLNEYIEKENQNICLKILRAGRGFADVLKYIMPDHEHAEYDLNAPPVDTTAFNSYPTTQCRIDIFKAGSSCLNKECKKSDCWFAE